MNRQDRPLERLARSALFGVGGLLLVAALLPELRRFPDVDLGRGQWLFLLTGLAFVGMGLLGPRRGSVYRASGTVLLNTIVALVLVEVLSTVVVRVLRPPPEAAPVEFATARSNPFFADKPWADAFWSEAEAAMGSADNYHPYVIWRSSPFQGEFVRVSDQGFRHTPGSECTPDSYRVVLFGSSALWGWGVPDDGTIASYLQQALAERPGPVCVQNRAQNGFVSTQDLLELFRMAQRGEKIDLAVFFHGFNDASALFETKDAGSHYMVDDIRERMKGLVAPNPLSEIIAMTATGRLAGRIVDSAEPVDRPRWSMAEEEIPLRTQEAIHAYLVSLDVIRDLGRRTGTDVAFFWQPYAEWGRSGEDARAVPGAGSFDGRQALIRSVYRAVRDTADAHPDLHFLADEFIDASPALWLDYVHLSPPGNERVAQLILEAVEPSLASLAQQ